MGYDMHVRPRLRGADRPADYYDSPRYLRRNIFGMSTTVEAMVELGMAFWSRAPEFPESPNDWEAAVRWDNDTDTYVALTSEGERYLKLAQRTLTTHGERTTPGIPSHKFSTNDGWHVTAEECRQAVEIYDAAMALGRAHPEMFMDDVIPFLRLAAAQDGFEVY